MRLDFGAQLTQWTEPFCGSAAMMMRLHGDVRPWSNYMGGKLSIAVQSLALLGLRAGGRARVYRLHDAGPQAGVIRAIVERGEDVAALIEGMGPDGREGWEKVKYSPVPTDPVKLAAAFVVMQTSSILQRPPVDRGFGWRSCGYAKRHQSAIDKGFPDSHRPMALAAKVRALHKALRGAEVVATRGDWRECMVPDVAGRSVVYLDPPYAGTEGFRRGAVDVAEVVDWGRALASRGHEVVIAEGRRLSERAVRIDLPSAGGVPARRDREEWLSWL